MDTCKDSHTTTGVVLLSELSKPDDDKTMDSIHNTSDSDLSVSSTPESPAKSQGEDVILDVECGLNKGVLYLNRLSTGSKGACVLFDNAWLTPNEFQYVSGRETAKDWKRSIKHYGKSLKLLIAKGFMTTVPASCKCEGCVVIDDKSERGETDNAPKSNQENVPPPEPTLDATGLHTPELARRDKDKTRPEVSDSHVTGYAGSEGKASVEIAERPVLQSLGEDVADAKPDVTKKTGKKRKSQSKGAEKPKKPRKRSHDVTANPTGTMASEATLAGCNGSADQSCVPVSGANSRNDQETAQSGCNLSFSVETVVDERPCKVAPESSLLSQEKDVCRMLEAENGGCAASPSSPLRYSPHTLLNPEVNPVNEVHVGVVGETDQTLGNKGAPSESIAIRQDDTMAMKPTSQVTGQSHRHPDDDPLVTLNRCRQMEALPNKSDSGITTNINPAKHSPHNTAIAAQSVVSEPETSFPAPPAKHALYSAASDVTSFEAEANTTRMTPESEETPARGIQLNNSTEQADSAPIIVVPTAVDSIQDVAESNIHKEKPESPRRSLSPASPRVAVDDNRDDDSASSDDSLPLSPRKEARLTCIIAELKSYKKQLIQRIEHQKVTVDDDITDEGVNVKATDNVDIPAEKQSVVEQEPDMDVKANEEDKVDPSQKCKTLYHILSSGNLPEAFKSPTKSNNNNNNSNSNNNNNKSTPLTPAQSMPDTQPLRSTFEKREARPENRKPKEKHASPQRENREAKKDLSAKIGHEKKTNVSPRSSHVVTSVAAPPVVSPIAPIPSSMYLAPPLFPFPYGIPPGYLYPGSIYGGFPYPDPTAIYKSLAASNALPSSTTTSDYSIPTLSPYKSPSSSGTHSPGSSRPKNDSRPNNKSSKKEKQQKSKFSLPSTGSGVHSLPANMAAGHYMPMFPFGVPDMTYMSSVSKVPPPSGHSSKHGKTLANTTPTVANTKSKSSTRERPHSKSSKPAYTTGVLDLSTKKRPSPIPDMDPYASGKRPCHTYEPTFHHRNGLVLDLSKSSAR